MKTFILILLPFFLCYSNKTIRHKRRSRSKFASDILTDIAIVRNELKDKANNDPSLTILHLHIWQSNIDTERQINDCKDYQTINDFYTTLKTRNDKLLQNLSSNSS
jgi:predicted MPP superfamily phosphohydrolase